jgi:hypothetical protein
MSEQDKNHAYQQAVAQATSIYNMVGALNVDYERLEELRDIRDNSIQVAGEDGQEIQPDELEELRELEEAANGNESEDEARERIQEDALEVQVRSGWYNPCSKSEGDSPEEFYILLCTGGPAVRIMGKLNDYCEPCRAWIQAQDWGTPWFDCVGIIDQDTLLQYCRQFYFGE